MPQTNEKRDWGQLGMSFCGQGMASNVIQVLGNPERSLHPHFPWGRAKGILFAHA